MPIEIKLCLIRLVNIYRSLPKSNRVLCLGDLSTTQTFVQYEIEWHLGYRPPYMPLSE